MQNSHQTLIQSLVDDFAAWFEDDARLQDGRMSSDLYPYEKLFSPIRVNTLKLKNRIVMGPMGNVCMADETGSPGRKMLAYLQAFGELLNTLKAVTMRGESFNTATLRMLAHLPSSMQNLLDQIPQRISVLNEIIKGTEVFSNVGRVAPNSSLSRFSSARDDGETKQLIWGFLTDDKGTMHITLRDFRPFVPLLLQLRDPPGQALADLLARDYLQVYVQDFNRFIDQLSTFVASEKPG